MNSEKWCSTARKLFTALTVIIVLLVFINAVIQAVALGEQDAGAAVWAFFIIMIGGCLGRRYGGLSHVGSFSCSKN